MEEINKYYTPDIEIEEIWKPVKGFEDKYEVSNFGKVRRLPYLLKSNLNGDGYPQLTLIDSSGKKYNKSIHRLVAETFIENPDNKETVNHKNGNKKDYKQSNLEWMTYSENTKHAFETGLVGINCNKRENNPGAKLTEEDVKFIKEELLKGTTSWKIWKSYYPDLHYNTVNGIKQGRTWK